MQHNFYIHSRSGFTLVELIVGMTIFAIGLTGILALLGNTITNSSYSRHEIVVAWLLREQMELVKNIRDTNLVNYRPWDAVFTEDVENATWRWGTYIIENSFTSSGLVFDPGSSIWDIRESPVYLKDVSLSFAPLIDNESKWIQSRLYLDDMWRYTHTSTATGTAYASYMIVSPLGYTGSTGFVPVQKDGNNQWYIIDARVIVKNGNVYREYDTKTAITDWVK